MVVSRHNFGYYVKQWSPKEIEQMFELKEKTHQILVNYAIERTNPEALSIWKHALDDYLNYRCEFYNVEKFRLDMNFHVTFSRIVGNDYLTSVLSQQYSIMSYIVDLTGLTQLMPEFEEDHKSIYKAILDRDVVKARKMLRIHDRRGTKLAVRLAKEKYAAD
jgi:DNA-binding GntR family transcriptional regulator